MKYYLYTDGSANNFSPYGEGGYAYIIANQDKQIISQFSEGELHATNNTMELKAIIKGCKAIKEDNAKVTVVSDSQYALNVLSGKWKAKANFELIQEHLDNIKRLDIEYVWVKGHNGNELNELADQLAQDETFKVRQQYGIPVYDVKNSPKVQSKIKAKLEEKKRLKGKPTPQSFYIYIEILLSNGKAFGAYSIFDEHNKEYRTNVKEYWCRTEPRLRLLTLYQALKDIPSKSKVIITPVDNYMQYAVGKKTFKPDVCNADILSNIRKECCRVSTIEFKNITQSFQEHKALEALCNFIGRSK